MKPFPATFALTLSALSLTACSGSWGLAPYRIDVRQGNMVTQEMVSQLRPGMSKDQVRFVLGSPLVVNIFHADRWDYVYRIQPGRGETEQRVVTVFFADGKLTRLAGDVVAASASDPGKDVGNESAEGSPPAAATPNRILDAGPAENAPNAPAEPAAPKP